MQSASANAPAGRTLLIELAEGKSCTDFGAVARELGMFPSAFDQLAQRAYPLSPAETATQRLLRDIGRVLFAKTQASGVEAALAELVAAASDPRPETLLGLLARPS
jgi:hypothetical protein